MSTILDVLEGKGTDVHCIDPGATVFEAVTRMVEHNVGSLLVTRDALHDYASRMVGVITERDYLRKVVIRGKTSRQTPVAEIMSQLPRVVGPYDDVDACLAIMTAQRIRHLPVVAGKRIVGIVSIGDLTKRKLAETRAEVEQIVGYLQGVSTRSTFGSICYGRSESIRGGSTRRGRWASTFSGSSHAGTHRNRFEPWGSR